MRKYEIKGYLLSYKAVVRLLLMWTKSEAVGDLKGQDHPHQGQFL